MVSDLVIVSAASRIVDGCGAVALSKATGRAVLVVPGAATVMPGTRVAVRWDGTRQTASALREARPLLRDAESIWVVDVEGRARRGFRPNDAACYLERHGFDSYQIEADDCCLADLVAHQDIDLVIGAEAPTFWSPGSPEQLADALRIPLLVSA